MGASRFAPQQGPPGNQSTSTFSVDASEVMRLGFKLKGAGAPRIIRVELTNAMQRSVEAAKIKANSRVKSSSGDLVKSAKTSVRTFGDRMEGKVKWTARSDKGFPYPIVIESGRKAFGPKTAPFLQFKGKDGKWVRTMWVKAYPGIQFASKGLIDAEPQIVGFFRAAGDRIATRVEALVAE